MKKTVLFIAGALLVSTSVAAQPADYTDELWSTVAVEWLEPALRGNDPQQVNRARHHCGSWASRVANARERQRLYVRCLRAELPATHFTVIDMTDPQAVQSRYPETAKRN